MVFASWVEDTFGINTIDLNEPTQFSQTWRADSRNAFQAKEIRPEYKLINTGPVSTFPNYSRARRNERAVPLVKEKTAISPESVATFVIPGRRARICDQKRSGFSLHPHEEIKYKLIDVQLDKAIIVNMQKPDAQIEIGLLAP